jgi:hypothetical protein
LLIISTIAPAEKAFNTPVGIDQPDIMHRMSVNGLKIPGESDNLIQDRNIRSRYSMRLEYGCQRQVIMATLIKEAALDRMFNDAVEKKNLKQSGQCAWCGSDVVITIERTFIGYGFQGGVLYESNTDQILMKCEHCFKNIVHSNNFEDAG